MKIEQTRRTFAWIAGGAALMLAGIAAWLYLSPGRPAIAAPALQPVSVSYPAPALQLTALDGTPVSLQDHRDQVVLLNLWATWCPPCKAEMPALQAFYDLHGDEGFVVIAVNDGESERDVSDFVIAQGLTFAVWLDPEHAAARDAFRTLKLPSSFVIDRLGLVRLYWVGGARPPFLEQYVLPIIQE
ncbi:MAG TPA: TlpA disulfide reductase family protein [Anaerolineales bacterium]|jgi:thiol-disulfide isomerase/thioredoxin